MPKYSNSFNIMKGVRQGCPLSPILFNLFINDIFTECEKYGVPVGDFKCCGGLFADDVVLCAPSRTKLKKLLKRVNEWAIHNKMTFGINKCATMVIRPDNPLFSHKKDPTFYLAGLPIPKTNRYTYLGIPFDKSLSFDPIVNSLNNKVGSALSSVKQFLNNPFIPIPFKKTVLNSIVISKVSYFAPLLGSNKERSRSAQTTINRGLNYIAGVKEAKSLTSTYCISKDLNIPPLSAKCALAQDRCFNKWKNSNCIIAFFVKNPSKRRRFTWAKSCLILHTKLSKHEDKIAIIKFYWKDMKNKSIKAEVYDDNDFENTNNFLKLCYEYPDYYYGFYWLLKARSGYKLDAKVAKAAKIIDHNCPNYCPMCKSANQSIEHWLTECPYFNDIRTEFHNYLEPVINFFNNNSSISNNNNANNATNENSTDNLSVDNSNSSLSNINTDNDSINNNVYNNSSVCKKIFKFLLGGQKNNFNIREWKELCKCQTESGVYTEIPFLVVTAALLNKIMPIAIGQQWSMFNRFPFPKTKSVNADETVRQDSRSSATGSDHNFTT